jgi:hypothetical protein
MIQNNYQQLMQAYQNVLAQQAQALKMAESQFIPSGGAMIKVAYYVPDPTNKARSIQATLPAESIDWLIKQLSAQGSAQEQLQELPQNLQASISGQVAQMGMPPRQMMPPMGQMGSMSSPVQQIQGQLAQIHNLPQGG